MLNNKDYYRKLEAMLDTIENQQLLHHTLAKMVDHITEMFREDLGIVSGRLYSRRGDTYICRHSTGPLGTDLNGFSISANYPPIQTIIDQRVVAIHDDFPGYDADLENQLGLQNYAAFSLEGGRYLISFGLISEVEEDSLIFALGTIRHSLSLRLRQAGMEAELDEAEAIQRSLLPQHPPRFEGFDIAASSHSAEAAEVGGDIYDFLQLGNNSLGFAIGDASGHGLPAALQARDVVTGLRMGVEKEMKITAVMKRLNKVIHASRLSTRFVSLFYGELEQNGNLIYVNAGHCEPIIIGPKREVERLQVGGVILGPTPDAQYTRGFTTLLPGSQFLSFTDGVVERMNGEDEFGEKRLLKTFQECYRLSSRETVDRILETAKKFGESSLWEDDVTLLVIKPTG